jgi:hypothetical protein
MDQLVPFQRAAPVLTGPAGVFLLPTTHALLLAIATISRGLSNFAGLDTVFQEGPHSRPPAPGTATNSKRSAANSAANADDILQTFALVIPVCLSLEADKNMSEALASRRSYRYGAAPAVPPTFL